MCQVSSGGNRSLQGSHAFAAQSQSCLSEDDGIHRWSDSGGYPLHRSDCMSMNPFSQVPMEAKHQDDLYCVALVDASATGLQASLQDLNLAGHGTDTDFSWWLSGPCSNAYQENT